MKSKSESPADRRFERPARLALFLPVACCCVFQAGCRPAVSVTTQHNDASRTGANLQETALNVSSVRCRFGKLFSRTVLGAVYAQPLVLAGVDTRQGKRNLVYIATMHNMVYAFDADDAAQTAPVWAKALGPSVRLPDSDVGGGGYNDVSFEVGIVSTPVIDRLRNAVYVVAFSKENGRHI